MLCTFPCTSLWERRSLKAPSWSRWYWARRNWPWRVSGPMRRPQYWPVVVRKTTSFPSCIRRFMAGVVRETLPKTITSLTLIMGTTCRVSPSFSTARRWPVQVNLAPCSTTYRDAMEASYRSGQPAAVSPQRSAVTGQRSAVSREMFGC